MSQIIFKNGHSCDAISLVSGDNAFIQGQSRPIVNAYFTADKFDSLREEVTTNENLEEITVIDDRGNKFVHSNFFKNTLGLSLIEVTPATDTSPAVTEERAVLTLAQFTYMEVLQKQQAAALAQSDQAIAELSILIAGGNA